VGQLRRRLRNLLRAVAREAWVTLPTIAWPPSQRTLKTDDRITNLVIMTRSSNTGNRKRPRAPGRWLLQDAKARFSELVRRAHNEGPQMVTVRGRDEVVVVAADQFRRLKGDRTGAALVEAMQASPYREIDIEPRRERFSVRGVDL
jgi:prevent-host-death family protein